MDRLTDRPYMILAVYCGCKATTEKQEHSFCSGLLLEKELSPSDHPWQCTQSTYCIYSAIRRGFPLSRMSTNKQISLMQICSNMSFTLPKRSQRSRSVL